MSIIDDIISSAQGQNQSGSSGQTPFDRAADFTLDNEGSALVPDDAGKGPSKFGINKTANPDVDVPNLTRDAAKALYKQRYWNGINGDRLAEVNPDLALVAHDVAATAGVRRANQMVAQSGGDPNKLLQLRNSWTRLWPRTRRSSVSTPMAGLRAAIAWRHRLAATSRSKVSNLASRPVARSAVPTSMAT